MHPSFGGKGTPFVKSLFSMGDCAVYRIHHHVAGAGVEGENLLRLAGRGQAGDVADTADVLQGNALGFAAVDEILAVGH